MSLNKELTSLKGVGEKISQIFHSKGITNYRDLLFSFPRSYEDRTKFKDHNEIHEGQHVFLLGKVISGGVHYGFMRGGRSRFYEVLFEAGEKRVVGRWIRFHEKSLKQKFKPGSFFEISGRISKIGSRLVIIHPECEESLKDASPKNPEIIPVYSQIQGVSKKLSRELRRQIIDSEEFSEDHLPIEIVQRQNLPKFKEALKKVHFPDTVTPDVLTEEQRRFIFEELFIHQCAISIMKKERVKLKSNFNFESSKFKKFEGMKSSFLKAIGFSPTGDQAKVMKTIEDDFASESPMNRLIHGDVGCGKTMVAQYASFLVSVMGKQVAIMAPTEVLASQHHQNFKDLFSKFGVEVSFLSGSMKTSEKKKVLAKIKSGESQIVIGTHALFQKDVHFKNLSLVVVDEQHRFGVHQRHALINKGKNKVGLPHILVLSATPIPRTLALTLYRDLDLSGIYEMPKGRKPVSTRVAREEIRPKVSQLLKREISLGRQAFVIVPRILETEDSDLVSIEAHFEKLKNDPELSEINIQQVHGAMKSEDKNRILNEFKSGEIQILLSTTVVEVGVNVPNANVMVIENCERFGISQLHQMRGRVGRGEAKSYCVMMMGESTSLERENQLKILEKKQSGFDISLEDLNQRGAGEIFGTRQSGEQPFEFCEFPRDLPILENAIEESKNFMSEKSVSLLASSYPELFQRISKLVVKLKRVYQVG